MASSVTLTKILQEIWNLVEGDNPASALSCTSFVITYVNCPLIWTGKLWSEIALSTTEVQHIALSQAMKEIISLINIIGEVKTFPSN